MTDNSDSGLIALTTTEPPVTDTEQTEAVKPTRQRIRIAKTPAIVINGEIIQAANDNFVVDSETGAHRMQDAPLDRLYRTGAITYEQHAAGKRYFEDFFAAGLAPLGAFDYTRPIVDGASPKGESDYRVAAIERWRHARRELGDFFGPVADAVLLREVGVEDAGRSVSGRADRREARAVGNDRLIGALNILAAKYGLLEKKKSH